MPNQKQTHITLQDAVAIPQLGLGTWKMSDEEAEISVSAAIEDGYRSIDTAMIYGNEVGVGRGLRKSGVERDDIFVTTKLWNTDQGKDSALQAFETSTKLLDLTYVDLYLIHWPAPAQGLYVETWAALQRLVSEGRVRALGVSNFQPEHLQRLADETGVMPRINQVELHPHFQQPQLREFHREHGIVTEAWSPLGQGKLLLDPTLASIANKLGKSVAQVILRWHIQLGNVVIPKTSSPDRAAENFNIFDFELDGHDLETIKQMDTGNRTGGDPDTLN